MLDILDTKNMKSLFIPVLIPVLFVALTDTYFAKMRGGRNVEEHKKLKVENRVDGWNNYNLNCIHLNCS